MKLFVVAALLALAASVPLDSQVEDQDELEMHEIWGSSYQEVQKKMGLNNGASLSRSGRVMDSVFWKSIAQEIIQTKLNDKVYHKQAKNAILFIGDGMSIHTLAAARKQKGLLHGADMPEHTMLCKKARFDPNIWISFRFFTNQSFSLSVSFTSFASFD